MPILNQDVPVFKARKPIEEMWDNFRGGLNTLLKPTEVEKNDLVQADNLQLVGKGVPTKRGGTANYFLTAASIATGTQKVRGLKYVNFASGTSGVREVLAISDAGYLVKKSGASYSIIPGYSYASGYPAEMTQAFNNVYIANGQDKLTKYNGVTISAFTQLTVPTGLTATNLSGVSGTFTYSWRVSAENDVGETLASTAVTLANLPQDLSNTLVQIDWTTSTPTASVKGYVIYGRESGIETYIDRVPNNTLRWQDDGSKTPSTLAEPKPADTTQGPIYKYQAVHKDKLIGAHESTNPSRVVWTGGGTNIDKFHWSRGGGYVDIAKDDGDVITGIIDAFDSVIVFKERSIYQVTLASSGALVIPTVKMIMRGIGCVSHRTIQEVENDVFFLSRNGVYVLGYEPNIVDVLRTNEISAKVRSFFGGITPSQYKDCAATYHSFDYRIVRPDGKEIVYDRERLAWMGPHTYNAGKPSVYEIAFDDSNKEVLLWGDKDDNYVTEYSGNYSTDKGGGILTRLITRKENLKDPFSFKDIDSIYTHWRAIQGTMNVDIVIDDRTGQTLAAKSFSVAATNAGGGWGYDKWGTAKWGTTAGGGGGANINDIVRKARINKLARTYQLDVRTTQANDNYELLSIKTLARPVGRGVEPSSWDVG